MSPALLVSSHLSAVEFTWMVQKSVSHIMYILNTLVLLFLVDSPIEYVHSARGILVRI